MTGMEHAIEQAARAVHAGHCCPCDLRGCYEPDPADYNAARALAEAGLLAPSPLREEWAAAWEWLGATRIGSVQEDPDNIEGIPPGGWVVHRFVSGWEEA